MVGEVVWQVIIIGKTTIKMKGQTKYKKMSELPNEVREKIYKLRLVDDIDTPIEDYIDRYGVVLVEDTLYYAEDEHSIQVMKDFKQREEERPSTMWKLALPSAVIENGYVIKNRFGVSEKIEEPKMTKQDVLVCISAFEKITERVENVFEILKIIPEFEYIDHIEFEADKVIAYCENRWDNDSSAYSIPVEYLWMTDTKVKEEYQKKLDEEKKKKEEELAEQNRKKEEAKKKRQRTIYEKLKKKFENE